MTKYPAPAQFRGARAMLGWSMMKLAQAARVSVSTMKSIEDGQHQRVSETASLQVQRTLEEAGIYFFRNGDGGDEAVALRAKSSEPDVQP